MGKLAQDDEGELIARSQRGDVTAFNQLVLRYQQLVYSAIFRIVGNPDVAADVAQDTFFAAFRAIDRYQGSSSFRAWILRIGSNMACDHWRRVQRHRTESLERLTEDEEGPSPEMLNALVSKDVGDNPEEMVLTQELQGIIQSGLENLPLDQRVALILCDVQGLSYEEVAEATETSIGTVRSRISRGRARLRTYLYQHRELLPRDYRLT